MSNIFFRGKSLAFSELITLMSRKKIYSTSFFYPQVKTNELQISIRVCVLRRLVIRVSCTIFVFNTIFISGKKRALLTKQKRPHFSKKASLFLETKNGIRQEVEQRFSQLRLDATLRATRIKHATFYNVIYFMCKARQLVYMKWLNLYYLNLYLK